MKLIPLFCLLSLAGTGIAAESSKNAEAFQATSHYTKQMLGESQAMGGKVLEKIDVANYTYVQFGQGKARFGWQRTMSMCKKAILFPLKTRKRCTISTAKPSIVLLTRSIL